MIVVLDPTKQSLNEVVQSPEARAFVDSLAQETPYRPKNTFIDHPFFEPSLIEELNLQTDLWDQPIEPPSQRTEIVEEDDCEHPDDGDALEKTIHHCLEGFETEGKPRVLSVGTGMDALFEYVSFKKFFMQQYDYTAVDPDAKALSNFRDYLTELGARLIPADARELPEGEYDIIFMAHPMLDCGDGFLYLWREIFEHVIPMLVEGGRFVTTHYWKGAEILMRKEFDRLGLRTILSGKNPYPGKLLGDTAAVYSHIAVAEK